MSRVTPQAYEIGEIAYNDYCKAREWKAFNGDPLPKWSEVKEDVKAGWIAAGMAVVEHISNLMVSGMIDSKPVSGKVLLIDQLMINVELRY